MSNPVKLWGRSLHRAARRTAELMWVVWMPERKVDLRIDASRDGIPASASSLVSDFDLRFVDDRKWLGVWITGPIGTQLSFCQPPLDPEAMLRSPGAMVLRDSREDPADLAALQAGVGTCRALARVGALAILDVYAITWWHPSRIGALPAERPFDVREHVAVVFETDVVPGAKGHLCHTRGMKKFARPDIVMQGLSPAHANEAGAFLNEVANRMAQGKRYDQHSVLVQQVPGGGLPPVTFREIPDDSGTESPVFVNACLEVVDFDEKRGEARADCALLLDALLRSN